jgi:hypothetical protein
VVDQLHWLWMKNEWNPFMMMLASMTTYVINNGVSKHFLAKVMELKLIELKIIKYVIVVDLKNFKN